MISNKPYLIRAIYEWLVDNGWTPQMLVRADDEGVVVPREFVRDGEIVLNIAPSAVRHLQLGNDRIDFDARFAGRARQVSVPVEAVVAIFARENGQGMAFPAEEATGDGSASTPEKHSGTEDKSQAKPVDAKSSKAGSHLKVIK